MRNREFCIKCGLWFLAVALFAANVGCVIWKMSEKKEK